MRALITTIATIASLAPVAAFAAETPANESSMFGWIFLGFAALIVVAQAVPAALLMCGMVKGVSESVGEKSAAPAKL